MMLADRPHVEAAVEQLAQRHGYRVQRSRDAFAGRKLYLGYASVLGQNDHVEIDLNYLFRMPLAGTEMREMWQPGDLDRPRLRVVSMDELCVGKLLALLERTAARDAWDVGRLPEIAGPVLKSQRFRRGFIALSAVLNHPLPDYDRKLLEDRLTDRAVGEQLVPMLAEAEHPQASVLVERAWDVLAKFLSLEPNEQEYIAAIHHGDLRIDLLFPDSLELAARIGEHPAIQWKLQNVRRHRLNQTRPESPARETDS